MPPSWISGLCHFTSTRKEKQTKEFYKVAWNSQISITGFVKTFEKVYTMQGSTEGSDPVAWKEFKTSRDKQ